MYQDLARDFPFIKNASDIYFDSAATTQRPAYVIQGMLKYLEGGTSNIGRSNYQSAERAKKIYEQARHKLKSFIGGLSGELIFTAGFTDASNLLAGSLKRNELIELDEVVYTPGDHDSFLKPWTNQNLSSGLCSLVSVERNGYGEVELDRIKQSLTERTKVVLITHGHNVSGRLFDLSRLREMLGKDVLIIVDGAQSISHTIIELEKWGIDAFMFSGHKMFASFGIGGLWVSRRLYEKLSPTKLGGGSENGVLKFEPGTPNLEGVLSLKLSIEYLESIGILEIERHLRILTKRLYQNILEMSHVTLKYDIRPYSLESMLPIISFSVKGILASEVGDILAESGMALRTGTMCTGITSSESDGLVRASLHIYNTVKDVEELCEVLRMMKVS